jgi:hypothetical protein
MDKIFLAMAKNPLSPLRAILFFVTMSFVFSLLYWALFPLLEGTPSLSYGTNRLSSPRPAGFLDCPYFGVTTQTTVGYGDVVPVSVLGKVSTVIQAAFGYFYLAFLVSLFTSKVIVKSKEIQAYLYGTEKNGEVLRIR